MMLTEQEVSEIMIERIMTIETSRNLEKIQVSDQVHLMKDQEIMVVLASLGSWLPFAIVAVVCISNLVQIASLYSR